MSTKRELFHEKINCIYNILCNKDLDYFTSLFYIEKNKVSKKNRQIHLKKWINTPIYPRMFKGEYKYYPFFKEITINSQPIFKNSDEFLELTLETFCKRIKAYINQKIVVRTGLDIEYKYLYIFHTTAFKNHHIDYYFIKYTDVYSPKIMTIKVTPPKSRMDLELKPYYGSLKYQTNKIILTFENNNDYISALFNTDLISSHTRYLVGVGIGISDVNEKIPVAKKVILSKDIIENINEVYTILNETEIISAKENSYTLDFYDKNYYKHHLVKYIEKIDSINKLFTNLSKQQIFNTFYTELAFREFLATNKMFQRVKNNQPYYINYRKQIWDILLQSYHYEAYTHIYMVMPIYQGDNIFEYQSPKALDLQEELIALSNRVTMEFVFIFNDCKKPYFSYEFKDFLLKINSTIKIYFTFKSKIEKDVNSIDFIFTNKRNFVITKFLRVDMPIFNLYNYKSTIDEHEAMYRKILNRSIEYDEFIKDNHKLCSSIHPVLQALVGEWYHYVYGSQYFFEDRVIIYVDGTVNYFRKGVKTEYGKIIHKEQQSIILLNDIKNGRLFTITFDHHSHKLQKAFLVKIVTKQYQKEWDMFSIGIFSKNPIEQSKVQQILGDIDTIRLLEPYTLSDRLSDYLVDMYGYNGED